MYRYHGGKWQALETTYTGQAGGYYQYSSPTPGFSTFVIVGQSEGVSAIEPGVTPDTDTDTDTVTALSSTPEAGSGKGLPGFGIVAGIVGVLAVLYLKRK